VGNAGLVVGDFRAGRVGRGVLTGRVGVDVTLGVADDFGALTGCWLDPHAVIPMHNAAAQAAAMARVRPVVTMRAFLGGSG
jgi:hypothetical protein